MLWITQDVKSDTFEGIRAITQAYIGFALNHTEITRMMFSMKERTAEPDLYNASKAAAVPIVRIVEEAKRCDSLRNNDVEKTVRIIWAAIHGLAMLLMDEQMPLVSQSPRELSEYVDANSTSTTLQAFCCVRLLCIRES